MTENIKIVAKNKKARFEYEILESFEAGIVLKGTEVKSIRQGKVNISDGYASVKNGELWVYQLNIQMYAFGNVNNHDPAAARKLLVHKKEIKRFTGKLHEKGLTLVPLKIYFKNGKVKLELGIGKGKAKYDKREDIRKRDSQRDMQRIMKNVNK